jgi:beta-mannosidase
LRPFYKVFSLGVWKDVYLVPVAPTTTAITHVVPTVSYTGDYPVEPLTDDTAAPFHVDVTVHTRSLKATKATLTATGGWDASNPISSPVTIPEGDATVSINLTAHGVKLWWPNGFGEQPLYNLSVSLAFDTAASPADNADTASAHHVTAMRRVGFRYAVLVTGNDTDPEYVKAAATQEGSGAMTFIFRVNGAPVFAKVSRRK